MPVSHIQYFMKYPVLFEVLLLSVLIFTGGCEHCPAPKGTPYLYAQSAPLAAASPAPFMVQCPSRLTLFSGPDEKAIPIGRLKKGEVVTVTGYSQCYARVRLLNGAEGYVISGYLKALQPDAFLQGTWIVQPRDPYTYLAMQQDMAALLAAYPDNMQLETIGTSRQGLPIPAAVIGEKDAPFQVLVQAALHGREHMTALIAMGQAEYLLQKGVPEGVCFRIVPMSNPDGAAISQTGQGGELQRKIRQADIAADHAAQEEGTSYYRLWKANAYGVDLNRNFDAGWEQIDTRPSPSREGFRGEAPFCEPESCALRDYTLLHLFSVTLSYHAMGSEIYYAFGSNSPTNETGRALGEAICRVTGYPLIPDSGTSFGGYKDWAIEALGIPSLTLELGSRPTPLPEEEFSSLWLRNRQVLFCVAEWLHSVHI